MWLLDHFPTPSTYHFLFFYATFLVFNLIFISFAYCFSHPFDVYLNNVLFTLQSSIVCDIQFHFLTRYNMTSPFYSNSFNIIFFIFFSPFPLCIDLVFFLLFDCFGIRFVILLFNWECWYMFCYFVIQLGVLVYLLLFYLCGGCVGICFVIWLFWYRICYCIPLDGPFLRFATRNSFHVMLTLATISTFVSPCVTHAFNVFFTLSPCALLPPVLFPFPSNLLIK